MKATIQLCTYNRAPLLERVLEACFEQTVAGNGLRGRARRRRLDRRDAARHRERRAERATCAFTVVTQAELRVSHERATPESRGERASASSSSTTTSCRCRPSSKSICAAAQRIRARSCAAARSRSRISTTCRRRSGRMRNYSGNYFWTTNVSVPLATIRAIGGFDESFSEYGWEDIDVGLRLRAAGVRAVFNPRALVFHFKPRPRAAQRREDGGAGASAGAHGGTARAPSSALARVPRDREQPGAAGAFMRRCARFVSTAVSRRVLPIYRRPRARLARAARRARVGEPKPIFDELERALREQSS